MANAVVFLALIFSTSLSRAQFQTGVGDVGDFQAGTGGFPAQGVFPGQVGVSTGVDTGEGTSGFPNNFQQVGMPMYNPQGLVQQANDPQDGLLAQTNTFGGFPATGGFPQMGNVQPSFDGTDGLQQGFPQMNGFLGSFPQRGNFMGGFPMNRFAMGNNLRGGFNMGYPMLGNSRMSNAGGDPWETLMLWNLFK